MATAGTVHTVPATSGGNMQDVAAAVGTGLVAGAIPVALFNWCNVYGQSWDGWSLNGNGSLIVLPIAFPLCAALGALVLALPLRRAVNWHPGLAWVM